MKQNENQEIQLMRGTFRLLKKNPTRSTQRGSGSDALGSGKCLYALLADLFITLLVCFKFDENLYTFASFRREKCKGW